MEGISMNTVFFSKSIDIFQITWQKKNEDSLAKWRAESVLSICLASVRGWV